MTNEKNLLIYKMGSPREDTDLGPSGIMPILEGYLALISKQQNEKIKLEVCFGKIKYDYDSDIDSYLYFYPYYTAVRDFIEKKWESEFRLIKDPVIRAKKMEYDCLDWREKLGRKDEYRTHPTTFVYVYVIGERELTQRQIEDLDTMIEGATIGVRMYNGKIDINVEDKVQ